MPDIEIVKQWARRYWPDADETFSDPDCRAYYVRQYLLTQRRKAA